MPSESCTLLERVHPENLALIEDTLARAERSHKSFVFEARIVRFDEVERTVRVRGRYVYDSAGQPWRLVGAVDDVTGRSRLPQRARRAEPRLRLRRGGRHHHARPRRHDHELEPGCRAALDNFKSAPRPPQLPPDLRRKVVPDHGEHRRRRLRVRRRHRGRAPRECRAGHVRSQVGRP